jgi:hypothetical protein
MLAQNAYSLHIITDADGYPVATCTSPEQARHLVILVNAVEEAARSHADEVRERKAWQRAVSAVRALGRTVAQ